MKASQLVGNGGSIVSKIMELEIKLRIEFEHAHVKKTYDEDNAIAKSLKFVLKYDEQDN